MIARYLLPLCVLLLACGSVPETVETEAPSSAQPRHSKTHAIADAARIKLAKTNRYGTMIESGHRIESFDGHRLLLHLASREGRTVSLKLAGATPETVALAPGGWSTVQLEAKQSQVTLSWEGAPLILAEPFEYTSSVRETPKVLLISIDTLRADYFNESKMPRTYELFKDGIHIKMHTPTPWTLPAHISMLTSLYPGRHGVRLPDQKLSDEVVTMAETLKKRGFYNAAYTEGNYVSASFGLDQGFHQYFENPPSMLETDPGSLSKVADTFAAFERDLPHFEGFPTFVFLHTYEVHCPYLPHGDLTDDEGIGMTQWLLDNDGKDLSEAQLDKLEQLYAGEVAYVDGLLADLIERLPDGWLVALTSDHGEEFGEHGGLLHADHLYEETTRVPFAMMMTGRIPVKHDLEPIRSEGVASLVDVPPLLFTMIKEEIPEGWQGTNPLNPESGRESIFGESFYFGVQIPSENPSVLGIWQGDHKLTHTQNFNKSRFELFDLSADPAETKNLQEDDVRTRNALFKSLQAYRDEEGLRSRKLDDLTEEQLNTMRSLGYIK